MRRRADGAVVDAEVVLNCLDHDQSGVDANSHLREHAEAPQRVFACIAYGVLNRERGAGCAYGMVLVRDRGAKDRHQAVAKHLADGALVTVHGSDNLSQQCVEDDLRLLGVAAGNQFRRADDVDEHYGHELALALYRAARREDALGQVRRRRGRGQQRTPAGGDARQGAATAAAEAGRGLAGKAACGTEHPLRSHLALPFQRASHSSPAAKIESCDCCLLLLSR